ncbi:hypothetical protein M3Y95_01047800 [Aphelenchoides besseyi]|nr:hypothetical protein M3Y95_01047800 [Aphelenchoides besseyi]
MWKLLDRCVLVFVVVGRFACAEDSESTDFQSKYHSLPQWQQAIVIFFCASLVLVSIVGSIGGFIASSCSSCCQTTKPIQSSPLGNAPNQATKQPTVQQPAVQKTGVTTKDVAPSFALMPVDNDTSICNIAPIQSKKEKEPKTGKELEAKDPPPPTQKEFTAQDVSTDVVAR